MALLWDEDDFFFPCTPLLHARLLSYFVFVSASVLSSYPFQYIIHFGLAQLKSFLIDHICTSLSNFSALISLIDFV